MPMTIWSSDAPVALWSKPQRRFSNSRLYSAERPDRMSELSAAAAAGSPAVNPLPAV